MVSPLWLDELGTWWVIKDRLHDVVSRSWEFQGQSPLYYLFAWFARVVGGRSEVVLRLPSLVAGIAAAYLLYKLAARLIDREVGRLAVIGFIAWPAVAFSVSNVRPYALGAFAVIASTLVFVSWLDSGGWRMGILYVALAGLVVWTHYLFVLALFAHPPYAYARIRSGTTTVRLRTLAKAVLGLAIVVLPLAVQVASLWHRRGSLTIPEPVDISGFMTLIVPSAVAGTLVLGGVLVAATGPFDVRIRGGDRSALVLVCGWLLIPPVAFLLSSELTPLHFVPGRYSLSAAPAGAILLGWAIRSIEPASARRAVAAVLAILAVLISGDPLKAGEDWAGATAAVRSIADERTLVLVHPGLVESAQLDWFDDPVRRSYLLSPLSYYPADGNIHLIPYELDAKSESYVSRILDAELRGADKLVLLSRLPLVPYRAWLEGRLAPDGWDSRLVGMYGVVEVIEFTRRTSGGS